MSGRQEAGSDLADLLGKVADGDRGALRSIYVRLSSRLFGITVAILRDRVVAADVLQQGFVLIWQRARHFNPAREAPEAWMAGIVRHAALLAARTRGRERPLDDAAFDDIAVDPDRLDALQATPDGQRLREGLTRLDPDLRRTLVLAYVHGMSVPELAVRLKCPVDRVTQTVRQGIAVLRDALP